MRKWINRAGMITATANLDEDPVLDVWTVSSSRACEPFHEVEDIE